MSFFGHVIWADVEIAVPDAVDPGPGSAQITLCDEQSNSRGRLVHIIAKTWGDCLSEYVNTVLLVLLGYSKHVH